MGMKYYCQVSRVSWLYPDSVFGFITSHSSMPHDAEEQEALHEQAELPPYVWLGGTCVTSPPLAPGVVISCLLPPMGVTGGTWRNQLHFLLLVRSCFWNYLFSREELQQEVLESLCPYKKSAFINLLPFTIAVMLLCDNGKKIYSYFLQH